MIYGVGTDIVEVARIQKILEKSRESFLRKVLHPNEISDCLKSSNSSQRIAARFAAKEAVAKAFGTGISGSVSFQNIQVGNMLIDDKGNMWGSGKPTVILHGETLEFSKKLSVTKIHISLSHIKEYAIAFAVIENSIEE